MAPAVAAKINDRKRFAGFLVARRYGLSLGVGAEIRQALEALSCRQLGFPEETSLQALMQLKLSELLGATDRLSVEQLETQLACAAVESKSGDLEALRSAVLRAWLAGKEPLGNGEVAPPPPEDFDLQTFAATVQALARRAPRSDRFWDNKVFIAPLWRASQREHGFPRMALAEFKERLVEANRADLLTLSRADLVSAMDPVLVAESETAYLNATFHFVLTEGGRP